MPISSDPDNAALAAQVRRWAEGDGLLPAGILPDLEHAQPGSDSPTLCGIPADEVDLDRLTAAWEWRWPDHPPVAHGLRSSERWLRFHSLPGSKRYASDELEYTEILRRHHVILAELAGGSDDVIVVTCSWSGGATPRPRSAPVAAVSAGAVHWTSVLTDDDPEWPAWTHLWVHRTQLSDPTLDQLLRIVADDQTADVIIADPELCWLYHPYDGGADVYPETATERDALRERHAAWLSAHPLGL